MTIQYLRMTTYDAIHAGIVVNHRMMTPRERTRRAVISPVPRGS